jgi:hypothetical protein
LSCGPERLRLGGLGLAICEKLVALHGGTIHCESSRELGTAFVFTLPAALTLAEDKLPRLSASSRVVRLEFEKDMLS